MPAQTKLPAITPALSAALSVLVALGSAASLVRASRPASMYGVQPNRASLDYWANRAQEEILQLGDKNARAAGYLAVELARVRGNEEDRRLVKSLIADVEPKASLTVTAAYDWRLRQAEACYAIGEKTKAEQLAEGCAALLSRLPMFDRTSARDQLDSVRIEIRVLAPDQSTSSTYTDVERAVAHGDEYAYLGAIQRQRKGIAAVPGDRRDTEIGVLVGYQTQCGDLENAFESAQKPASTTKRISCMLDVAVAAAQLKQDALARRCIAYCIAQSESGLPAATAPTTSNSTTRSPAPLGTDRGAEQAAFHNLMDVVNVAVVLGQRDLACRAVDQMMRTPESQEKANSSTLAWFHEITGSRADLEGLRNAILPHGLGSSTRPLPDILDETPDPEKDRMVAVTASLFDLSMFYAYRGDLDEMSRFVEAIQGMHPPQLWEYLIGSLPVEVALGGHIREAVSLTDRLSVKGLNNGMIETLLNRALLIGKTEDAIGCVGQLYKHDSNAPIFRRQALRRIALTLAQTGQYDRLEQLIQDQNDPIARAEMCLQVARFLQGKPWWGIGAGGHYSIYAPLFPMAMPG